MIADIILILLLLLFAGMGMKKGFMKTMLSFAGIILSLIIAVFLTNSFAGMLEGTGIHDFIIKSSSGMLDGVGGFMATEIPSYEVLYEALSASMPDFIAKMLADSAAALIGTSANMTIAELLTPTLASFFLHIASFFILFVGSFIITLIVKAIVSAITSLPIISTVDKLLGFVLGLVKGILFISAVMLLLSFMGNIGFVETINTYIMDSFLASYMYNNNILLIIVDFVINLL